MCPRILKSAALAISCLLALTRCSQAALNFYVEPNGWPAGWYNAAVANMQTAVNIYNAYGEFNTNNSGNIYVYYNAGIPTAQSGYGAYGGSIGVGGTYPNVRVLLHESSHWLGTGTYSANWGGPNVTAIIEQFEGVGARLNGDGVHYWPYNLNYDSEDSPIAERRHAAVVYALRKDFGVGSFAPPSAATSVNLTASNAVGESGFNHPWSWSDNHFPQPGTNYTTGSYVLRTPTGAPSWNFAGESLTVNGGARGGLHYNGSGTTGVVTIKNLNLDGGTVRHSSGNSDLFQLAGRVVLSQSPTIDAAQGNILISAAISGSGSLTKLGSYTLTLSSGNTYLGPTNINAGTLKLSPATPVADYSFDNVSGSSVLNGGTGGAAMNGALAGGATIVSGGKYGNAVSVSGGASVNINNGIADLSNSANWTVSAWVKTTTPGGSLLTKGDGSGWANGNTIFYLGDGTAGGSGGIPSAVRYAGGFFQGSTSAASVTDGTWRHITYVNNGGAYAIYTDGVAQPLSAGNAGFSNADISSVVRLGVSTNGFAGDGTLNFSGLLDSVQVYNTALSATQVSALAQGLALSPLPITTDVNIAGAGTLDVNSVTQTIGSLSGPTGAIVRLGSAGGLTVSSAATTNYDGVILGSGTASFAKSGAGTLTITGLNTYAGGTTVSGGTLRVNNSTGSGTGAGPVQVSSGGTLSGTGFITGAVTIGSGATLAPGTGMASLDVGALTLAPGAILDFELNTLAGVDTSDLVNVTSAGGLTITGGTLNLTNLGSLTGGIYPLLDYAGTLTGSVSNLTLGAVPTGFNFSLVNNLANTSVDLIVTPNLPGDYNNNGAVDAADYVVWRDNLGASFTLPNRDPFVTGAVSQADYDFWVSQFGAVMSAAQPSTAAVPEPHAMLLVAIAMLGALGAKFLRVR